MSIFCSRGPSPRAVQPTLRLSPFPSTVQERRIHSSRISAAQRKLISRKLFINRFENVNSCTRVFSSAPVSHPGPAGNALLSGDPAPADPAGPAGRSRMRGYSPPPRCSGSPLPPDNRATLAATPATFQRFTLGTQHYTTDLQQKITIEGSFSSTTL